MDTTLILHIPRQLEITQRWGAAPPAAPGQRKQIAGMQAVLSLLQEVETASDQLEAAGGPWTSGPRGNIAACTSPGTHGDPALGHWDVNDHSSVPGQVLVSSMACGQKLTEVERLLQGMTCWRPESQRLGATVRPSGPQTMKLDSSTGTAVEVLQAKAQGAGPALPEPHVCQVQVRGPPKLLYPLHNFSSNPDYLLPRFKQCCLVTSSSLTLVSSVE